MLFRNVIIISSLFLPQLASLCRLEEENQEAARQLEEVVQQGETLLTQIQQALHDIAQTQLDSQALQSAQL